MSRNRTSTVCDCGYDLVALAGQLPIETPDLLVQNEYWAPKFYGGYEMGHGFRAGSVGDVHLYRDPTNRAGGTCSDRRGLYTEPYLAWTYIVPKPEDRYRWKRLDCPLCCRAWSGWFVQQPVSRTPEGRDLNPACWELYDTSYWYAHNDEPCDEDRALVDELTPAQLVEAVDAWRSKRNAA